MLSSGDWGSALQCYKTYCRDVKLIKSLGLTRLNNWQTASTREVPLPRSYVLRSVETESHWPWMLRSIHIFVCDHVMRFLINSLLLYGKYKSLCYVFLVWIEPRNLKTCSKIEKRRQEMLVCACWCSSVQCCCSLAQLLLWWRRHGRRTTRLRGYTPTGACWESYGYCRTLY